MFSFWFLTHRRLPEDFHHRVPSQQPQQGTLNHPTQNQPGGAPGGGEVLPQASAFPLHVYFIDPQGN